MRNFKTNLIFKILLVVLCFALVGVSIGGIVYSEYTKSTRGKRVISPHESTSSLFSSNYLSPASNNSTNRRVLYVKADNINAKADVTICNYAQGNAGTFCDKTINYNFIATLGRMNGTTFIAATAEEVGNLTIELVVNGDTSNPITLSSSNRTTTVNSTLTANIESTDHYLVELDTDFNTANPNNICVKLEATLVGEYPGLSNLNAVFSTALVNNGSDTGWSWHFDEPGASGVVGAKDPDELDGFNCVISGVGEGTVKFYFKTSALIVNLFFLSEAVDHEIKTGTGNFAGYSYIEIEVDSNTTSRYDFQLYRKENTADSFASWNIVKDYIKFEYTETQE